MCEEQPPEKVLSAKITPLILAVYRRDLPAIEQILASEDPQVNARGEFETTALITAAARGYLDVVCALMKSMELDLNARGGACGETALIAAARGNHVATVEQLVSFSGSRPNKVDCSIVDDSGDTFFIIVARNGFLGIIELFYYSHLRCFNIVGSNGETALIAAIVHGQSKVVRDLVSHKFASDRVDVNARGGNGDTALIVATRRGLVEMVKLLVYSVYLDPNMQATEDDMTALMIASNAGRADTVQHLLTADSLHVNMGIQVDYRFKTALTIAIDTQSVEVIRLLLGHPAIRIHQRPINCDSCYMYRDALHAAAETDNAEVIHALFEHPQINVNIDVKGAKPLTIALQEGNLNSIRALLSRPDCVRNALGMNNVPALEIAAKSNEEGACIFLEDKSVDVNVCKEKYGTTPLQYACSRGSNRFVKLMITRGARLNTSDRYGNTPLIDAARAGHLAVVNSLLDTHRVDVSAQNSARHSAKFVAKYNGHMDIVRVLTEHGGM
eukprot:94145_1